MEYDEDLKILVKKRLQAMPPEISFSVGKFGDFSRDELIQEVEKESEVGKDIMEMQLNFIRTMPILLKKSNNKK